MEDPSLEEMVTLKLILYKYVVVRNENIRQTGKEGMTHETGRRLQKWKEQMYGCQETVSPEKQRNIDPADKGTREGTGEMWSIMCFA
jgi:hypothetical protein